MKKAWIITASMGYGHQRAAYPFKDIAFEKIITANSHKINTLAETKQWNKFQRFYEGLSRFRSVPIIGKPLWNIYDKLQRIRPFYPHRDLSKPTMGSIYMHNLIRKGFLSSVIDYTKKEKIPVVNTFFATAVAGAHANRKNVYCIVTDSDINRIWVPENPKDEKIVYLAPSHHSMRRLIAYGVPEDMIYFTGFPLPKENTGKNLEILKKDIGNRLPNLDPKRTYTEKYYEVIKGDLKKHYKTKSNHPLTITFAVGGAGAQKEIAKDILTSLSERIKKKQIRINLIAGTRLEIQQYFISIINELGLEAELDKNITILCQLSKGKYFEEFNKLLHTTDILWTKPSELVFYAALGIPIIIAPPLGHHEELNRKWLVRRGAALDQEDPKYCNEWLYEWLNKGFLAGAAWHGFLESPKYGTENIEKLIFAKDKNGVKLKY